MTDLKTAKQLLIDGNYTCVLVKGEKKYFSTERGIRPLMEWLENGTDCRDFSVADKVVGRAAAFLYARLGVSHVHALVISHGAAEALDALGVSYSFDKQVDAILNRRKDGFCPMESAVREINDPEEAYRILSEKYHSMNP